ncbi:hypothetical protein QLS71_002765 [Mariniflexile litorale]|uniref:Uncharacterized protein n=1 Tax=Mariniflexile litorale TaxID=3045158 RepID=A0AAU7EJ92_9FLAO|nr:hypothetical protein [Mariniflexile sp. KMM 9835]MDQ8209941.1 hypothetical protein [Mariniflexile sp. KMM 9835]
MKDASFDYIYEIVTSHEDDFEWWENIGYFKLSTYLNNLNVKAIKNLISDSKSWHSDFIFILAEGLIQSNIENALEEYVKLFIEMKNLDHASYMGSILENTKEDDIPKKLYLRLKKKMVVVTKYERGQNENGKIIKLKE